MEERSQLCLFGFYEGETVLEAEVFLADLFLPSLGFWHRLVAVVSSVVMVGIVAVVGRVVGVGAVSLACCVKMFYGNLSVGLVDLESCCSCPGLHVVVILFSPPSVVGSVSGSFGDPVLAQVLKWNGAMGIDLCWVELAGSGQVVSANQPAILDLPLILWVQGSSVHVKSGSGSSVHVRRLVVCARFCCVILSL